MGAVFLTATRKNNEAAHTPVGSFAPGTCVHRWEGPAASASVEIWRRLVRRSGLPGLSGACYSAARMRQACAVVGCVLAVSLSVVGCATTGPFTWANDYQEPPAPEHPGYTIQPGDTIQIRVFNQPEMSTRARVREDGKISLPFLNDVVVAGQEPNALARQLQGRLKEFINAPVVTVSLEEPRPFQVAVVGELLKPGLYAVPPGAGVLQALAAAGGFNQYAAKDRIFVVRDAPQRARIRFTYEQLSQAEGKAATFKLRPGDSVVVE